MGWVDKDEKEDDDDEETAGEGIFGRLRIEGGMARVSRLESSLA